MLKTLWTSKSGMNAAQEKLDAISNNIANVNTTGYKKIDVDFKDLLSESLNSAGTPINNTDSVVGSGVRAGEWYRDASQGSLMQTYKATDMAIDGNGYFRVILSDGQSVYTRNGSFLVDSAGQLVDSNGNKLDLDYLDGYSENNVKFTSSNFVMDNSGNVYIKEKDSLTKVAQIPVYQSIGDNALSSIGNSYFQPNEGAQMYRTLDASFYQGFLETSNVDIAEEFSEMILTQRAFQLSSKGITVADEMWGMVNSLRR